MMNNAVYYYDPKKFGHRKRNSSGGKIVKVFSFLILSSASLITITLIASNLMNSKQTAGIVSPLPEKKSQSVLSAIADTVQQILPNSDGLKNTVTGSLEGTRGTYAIAIKNLKTGEEYYQNETRQFDSASLYKLWVMGTVYQQIQEGTLTPEKALHADIKTLNERFDIDPEYAELTEGGIDFTVKSALEQMITISHNYAALTLSSTVKISNVSKFIELYGLTGSKTGSPPQTTALDMLRFYEKLYNGEVVSPQYSGEMLETLKRQKLNDRIPKYLPEGTVVAHKTGELGGVKHDAGIVYSPAGDYIFVVMSESTSPQAAAERIALLSQSVYDYFNK